MRPSLLPRFLSVAALLPVAAAQLAAAPSATPPVQQYTKQPDPPVDPAQGKTLYTVGYAHLDTQWRWAYPQVVREFVGNTLHDNFKFIEKYPNYVFNFSGSRRYEMMREYYPDDYEKLKGYVAAGRWFPCGSSVDEADANVPSLESFVRQVLYGNRYFEAEFGKSSSEFMLPDCFGFPASLPSILAHCGVKGFSTQKLTWGSANGIPFKVGTWTGPDGKQVTAALDPGAYVGGISEDLSQSQSWLKRIDATGAKSGAFVDYHYYGTGDRGGAPGESSVQWLESSLTGKGPLRVVSSDAERMFNDLKPEQIAKLPNYKGELLLTEHSAGSITSQAYMKRWNRKNELLADAAEKASVTAMLLGGAPYPTRKLYEGWDLVLGSQMHDMLPGTSLPKAYEFCWNDEVLALNHFAAIATDAVGTVAAGLDTGKPGDGVALVVYNPLAQKRDNLVEAEVTFPTNAPENLSVVDPSGKTIAAQVLKRDGKTAKILFRAELPPVGFAAYTVKEASAPGKNSNLSAGKANSFFGGVLYQMANSRYALLINPSGDIISIKDKANQDEELLAGPIRLEFHHEKPKQFPAWNMDWADRQQPAIGYVDGPVKARVVENGPWRVAIEVERMARGSKFVQTIRLADGDAGDRVEILNNLDWQSQEVSLKAAFPFKHANPVASYDDKIGVVERGNNNEKKYEVPQHQWFDLTDADGQYGAAVLNDSKFGSDKPDDKTLRLTLLHTPGVRNEYQDQATQDIGRHEILYAVAGHKGDWRAGNVPAQAAELNQPLLAFQTTAHPGALGKTFSLLGLNTNQVGVATVKKAEASDEVVVRLLELTGREAGDVQLSGAMPIESAREITGQEKPLGDATVRDGKLVTKLGPFAVRAFAVKFGAKPAQVAPVKSQAVQLAYDQDAVSTQKNRADGGFDHDGVTYPAEQFPKILQSEGVDFQLGSTADGQKNAVAAHGQTIDLPAGDFNRVYILAAAHDGDAEGVFKVGDTTCNQTVQDWSGFVGQWDNRVWKGEVPELTYAWRNEYVGLVPGFTKRDTVAWYASHRHLPQKGNDFYQYCYLFKYGFDLPPGTRKLTLPDNANIGVFAVTVAKDDHAATVPATALYDKLERKLGEDGTAPSISPAEGQFNDSTTVTITHPLYWKEGTLHYTTDGSEPTESSPVYKGAFRLTSSATVRARTVINGKPGEECSAKLEVNDTTAPKLTASAISFVPEVAVSFSEPVNLETAKNPASYRLEPATAEVSTVRVANDGLTAVLVLSQPLAANTSYRLAASGVKDRSPAGNAASAEGSSVAVSGPIYTLESFVADGKTSKKVEVPGLPVKANSAWTVNFFVKTDKQPENRTLIAGFGGVRDDHGRARYLSKFANGIHFWSAQEDVETRAPLALNQWQMLTATYDGRRLTVYKDGERIGRGDISLADDDDVVELAPLDPWDEERRFAGEIRQFTVWPAALELAAIQQLGAQKP